MADNLDWHAVLAVLDRGAGPSGSDAPRGDAGGGRGESNGRTAGTLAEWAASHTPPPPRSQTPASASTLGPPHAQTHAPGADLLAQALLAQQLYGFGSAEYAAVLHHLAAGATAASIASSTSGARGPNGNAGPSFGAQAQAGPSGTNARSSPATPAPTPASPSPFAAPPAPASASSSSDKRPPPPPNPPPPPAPPRTPRGSVSATVSVPGTPAEDTEDKRVRNTLASARFRAKKKAHVETVERNIRALEAQHAELEVEVTDLKKENGLLKEMVQLKYAGGGGGGSSSGKH